MIKKLDSHTIDKIAAGEVIDRPASAVKELLENAIDSGANIINVSIKNGGKSEIIVQDNGKGIEHNELPLAVKRHATSKIETFEDLEKVSSLGFRGEALASIAAVAKVEIISQVENEIAWKYEINGGVEKAYEETAGLKGTKVIVRDLFYNVPARQKFLKSHVTESNHIGKKVQSIVLSHPEISFTYIVDGKEKIHTSGSGDLKKLIFEVFGKSMVEDGKIISEEENGIKLYGFLGSPLISRGNKNYEITFINGRIIENSTIFHAISEGYSGFLMDHKYPFVLIYLDIPADEVDVNVHPTKNDVKLVKANEIHELLVKTIYKSLNSHNMVHEVSLEKDAFRKKRLDTYNYFFDKEKEQAIDNNLNNNCYDKDSKLNQNNNENIQINAQSTKDDFLEAMKQRVFEKYNRINNNQEEVSNVEKDQASYQNFINSSEDIRENINKKLFEDNSEIEKKGLFDEKASQINLQIDEEELLNSKINVVGQIFKTYWVVEYGDEILIIDQHAAHEKVLFEKYLKEYKEHSLTTQVLNPPIMITLPIEEHSYIDTYGEVFKDYGFEIESVGEKDYLLRGVPYELEELGNKEAFQEFLDELFEGSAISPTPRRLKEKIAMCACKAAVKGNSLLSEYEIKKLIKEMMALDNPYNCPHGRPTMIKMTKKEIEKHFGRRI